MLYIFITIRPPSILSIKIFCFFRNFDKNFETTLDFFSTLMNFKIFQKFFFNKFLIL